MAERQRGLDALRRLFAYWIIQSGTVIEFYAARYEYAGSKLVPHAVLAALALGVLLLPGHLFARASKGGERLRALAVGVVFAAAFVYAIDRPLQFDHVGVAICALVIVLAALLPVLRLLPSERVRRFSVALMLAVLTFALLVYYAVLLVGREMWNQIVSRELLWSYFWQVPELVSALPVSAWIPWSIVAGVFLVLFLAYWFAAPGITQGILSIGSGGFLRAPSRSLDRRRALALCVLVGAVALSADWMFRAAVLATSPEPLLTSFFVNQDRPGSPRMSFVSDPALEARDREVAGRYTAFAGFAGKTLVLITVDALRADQMNLYGHERENTPFLTRLHREGALARFDNAFSACTESLCGLLAIHASRYWHQLGTRNFGLSDALKRLGYRNYFLLGGDHANFYGLRAYYGLNIDEYRDGSLAQGYMNDDAEVIRWLDDLEVARASPAFIYIHLMSVHVLGKRMEQYRLWYRTAAGANANKGCCTYAIDYENKYHDGVLQADALIERIFRILTTKRLLDDAVVVITADHGEMLGERGEYSHTGLPLDPVVRVPLLIYDTERFRYPARPLSSVIDIAPTLLDRIGAPIPEHWTGVSLARPEFRRFAIMQGRDTYAVVGRFGVGLYKYYFHQESGAEELTRLADDGKEHALSPLEANPGILTALREELDRHRPSLRHPQDQPSRKGSAAR